MWGVVQSTEPVTIRSEYAYYADGERHAGVYEFTIRDVTDSVAVGDRVQVYGIATEPRTVNAETIVAVPPQNYLYMFGVSGLAGFWVLARLINGWRLNSDSLALQRRATTLTSRFTASEEDA